MAQKGLFNQPTLVNNVETVYWIPRIHAEGADWFASQGRHGRKGLRSFSVSGRVARPGVHVAPAGITLNELIEEYCGGMAEGHCLLAYLPVERPAAYCRPAKGTSRSTSTLCRNTAASSALRP